MAVGVSDGRGVADRARVGAALATWVGSAAPGGAPAAGRYDSQVPQVSEAQPAFSTANSGDFEEIVGDDELPF
jgi:hypothetical protein